MRRVQSIALVHETLSVSIDEAVDFDEIVDRLLGMLSDVMGSEDRVTMGREGSFGEVPAEVATALVLVLTEIVQNAVEHAYPDERSGTVSVIAERARGGLTVTVRDDGVGLPEGFSAAASDRLGLQIVHTLVSAELDGTVEFRPVEMLGGAHGTTIGGAEVVVWMPLARRSRTGG